jgi:hypothetical protein
MNKTLDNLKVFAQLPLALRRFSRHTMTLDEAKRIVHRRMARREENFLRTVERSIYGHPGSPYLALLRMAGCELGDLRALVRQRGLEAALRALRDAGVYVTFEEFKGRKPIHRHGKTISVTARDFDNPAMQRVFTIQSGGSTGAATTVGVNLEQIAARAPHELLSLSAHDLLDVPVLRWSATLPSGTLRNILRAAHIGRPPYRWFSPTGLRDSKYWLKYALATYYILFWIRVNGMRVPLPQYVRVQHAGHIARCVSEVLRAHGRCVLHTSISRAVRVCQAAGEANLNLGGAVFRGTEEPATPAKVGFLNHAGVPFIPIYGMVEANRIASGCAHACDVDDMHLLKDALALFAYPYHLKQFDVTVPAFNLTTLLPTASKVLLNVQMDDYGIIEERHCGCELESYGYTTHVRRIRSYGKLVGEGVTLIGNELMHLLEEVLPARFGGTPLDYQMVEREDEQGLTRLFVLIHPRIELADEQQVVDLVLDAMRESSPMADAARVEWQQMETVRVQRAEPMTTARGKVLPLHIERHMEPRAKGGER